MTSRFSKSFWQKWSLHHSHLYLHLLFFRTYSKYTDMRTFLEEYMWMSENTCEISMVCIFSQKKYKYQCIFIFLQKKFVFAHFNCISIPCKIQIRKKKIPAIPRKCKEKFVFKNDLKKWCLLIYSISNDNFCSKVKYLAKSIFIDQNEEACFRKLSTWLWVHRNIPSPDFLQI